MTGSVYIYACIIREIFYTEHVHSHIHKPIHRYSFTACISTSRTNKQRNSAHSPSTHQPTKPRYLIYLDLPVYSVFFDLSPSPSPATLSAWSSRYATTMYATSTTFADIAAVAPAYVAFPVFCIRLFSATRIGVL